MTKKIALLLIIVLTFICSMVACKPNSAEVTKIEILDTQVKYSVGDIIDYQNIKIKVYYSDNTTKESTVAELGATIQSSADLTAEGNTSYTIEYKEQKATKNISVVTYTIVNYMAPSFWYDYQNNIKGSSFDDDSKFIDTSATYEVGNANKFIFKPVLEGMDSTSPIPTTITQSPKTIAKVYLKSENGTYGNHLEGDNLANYVSIQNNQYQFTEDAAGKVFKMEISLDTEAYILSSGLTNTTITIEFIVVDGGYNVYDQDGLAVMTDGFVDSLWADIFKKNTNAPLQLEADTKPLYQYVGNVKYLILHGSIVLDAEKLPKAYFWQENDVGFQTAEGNLSPIFEGKVKLVGSLKDGLGEEHGHNTPDYVDNNVAVATANAQKSLYMTMKCSFSGNYFDIKVPTVDNTDNTNRRFYTAVWFDTKNHPNAPTSHWSIFKTAKSRADYANELDCNIVFKNCSMTGNNGKTEANVPAGMMMLNSAVDELIFQNIIGTSFYVNLTQDNYSMGGDRPFVKSNNQLIKSKFLDSCSNMITTWRGTFNIVESVLKRAGGPLFIMMDGDRTDGTTDDTKGPKLTVDAKSKLEAYATGNENWYAQYNAQPLIMGIKSMNPLFAGYFNKTMFDSTSTYINVIAIIIPDPASIMNPSSDNISICGYYSQLDENNNVISTYAMNNPVMTALRAQSIRSYVFQSGNNFAIAGTSSGQPVLLNANGIELQQDYAQNGANSTIAQWRATSTNTLCIYMSASLEMARFPYFGVILGFNDAPTQ